MTGSPPPALVTGAGVIGPCGRGTAALWRSLMDGDSNRRRITHFEAPDLTVGLVPGEEGRAGDPGRLLELLVAAAGDALSEAGFDGEPEVTLVVGTTDCDGGRLPGWTAEEAAERLCLRGEAITVASASASGGAALEVGRDLLAAGEAQAVLVAGADRVTESAFHGLRSLRTLSAGGCRPFSAERGGIGVAEGAAALVLQSQDGQATARRGRLLGCGSSNLAGNLAVSEAAGIAAAVEAGLADAGLGPAGVGTVNAHGPGTVRGDAIEIEALRAVFGERLAEVAIVSSKGALWHWQGAAGVVETIACLLCHGEGMLAPTHGATPVDPRWEDLDVVLEPRSLPTGASLSISCGLGGINTATVVAG